MVKIDDRRDAVADTLEASWVLNQRGSARFERNCGYLHALAVFGGRTICAASRKAQQAPTIFPVAVCHYSIEGTGGESCQLPMT
jgi:hypothetical protein